MSHHDNPVSGLWTTSNDQERFNGTEGYYDTRGEAIAADPEASYVVQVHTLTADEVAAAFLRDVDEADEHICMQDDLVPNRWHGVAEATS